MGCDLKKLRDEQKAGQAPPADEEFEDLRFHRLKPPPQPGCWG
jgi:hypothetical protein